MRLRYCLFSILIILFTSIASVSAQDLCAVLVQEAFEEVNANCLDIASQSACYGHDRLVATFNVADILQETFSRPSDFIEVFKLYTVHTQPLDLEADEWGVAYFQIQANLDSALSDESVKVFMVGDVILENTVESQETTQNADVLTPMQSFNFSTGGESICQEAPNAVIVQGPEDVEVDIIVNGTPVRIGSTVMFGTDTDDLGNEIMWVAVVAGKSTLFSDTPGALTVQEGFVTTSFLSDDSAAGAEPVVDSITDTHIKL